MSSAKPALGPGRPKDMEKRAAMLEAAKMLFLAHGFEGTSMDAIAQRAGVSKLTVYSHFKGKDALFSEVVLAKCRDQGPMALKLDAGSDIRAGLYEFASAVFDLVFSDEAVQLYRIIMAETRHKSTLGRLFHEAGPEPTRRMLDSLIRKWQRGGQLCEFDSYRAATEFFCLLKGEHHLRMLIGVAKAPHGEAREQHLQRCVDAFLTLYPPCSHSAGTCPGSR